MMNKRAKKKEDKRRRAIIHAILDEVLDINGLEPRCQRDTGDKPTAFFDFSGQVAWLTVQVYSNGWSSHISEDFKATAHTDAPGEPENLLRALKKARAAATATGNKE